MEKWTIVKKDGKDYRMKTLTHGNATINIYRPILTEQERKKREKEIMETLARILRKYPTD